MRIKSKLAVIIGALFVGLTIGNAAGVEPAPPKLILQITVDQLRGDLPQRFLDRMGERGFRYLLDQGDA